MRCPFPFSALVVIGAISFCTIVSESKAAVSQLSSTTHPINMQSVGPAATRLRHVIDAQTEVETLIRELRASLEDVPRPYDSIRIVSQLGKLGAQASPAVDILIELLGKQLADCNEELRLCQDKTRNCPIERRSCPDGAEMHKHDYLTPYAFTALRQIGDAALPKLSVVLNAETLSGEGLIRGEHVARLMGSIGPAAIPFLSDILRAPGHSQKRLLALSGLNSVLFQSPASGNQLASLVPYITPFLSGDFETIDQAIRLLGAIGPGAVDAVPSLITLLSYQRVLPDLACPVGERIGYIFRAGALDALVKIGTPEAMRAVDQYKVDR